MTKFCLHCLNRQVCHNSTLVKRPDFSPRASLCSSSIHTSYMSMTAIIVNHRQQPPPTNQHASGTSAGIYLAAGNTRATLQPARSTSKTCACCMLHSICLVHMMMPRLRCYEGTQTYHYQGPPMTANHTVYVQVGATISCRIQCEVVSSVQASATLWFTAMIAHLTSTCSSRTKFGKFAACSLIANNTGAGTHRYNSRK